MQIKNPMADENNKKKSFPLHPFKFSPTQIIVGGFFLLIMFGAILLTLPISSSSGKATNFIDALFTATSATCVTGLVVFDTNTYWSWFGKVVIIMLIQVGGLGIMSMSTIFALVLKRQMGLKERIVIQESISEFSLTGIVRTIKSIIMATLAIELTGALLLSTQFIPMYGFYHGALKSLFHAISAFCNAGFDLFGREEAKFVNLVPFQQNPVILITIALLIILGGLGFIVWKDIYFTKKFHKFMLHTKIVIISTLLLIFGGALMFLIFEHSNPNTFGPMSWPTKILNAFFQSVTPRTAGFNSVNLAELEDTSSFLTIILMFIGAAPGSTGGGIKVTTFSVIFFTIVSSVRGSSDINMLKRRVPLIVVTKAISITALSMLVVITTTMILTFNHEGSFLECVYEATSAFGTVGLTMGITPSLDFSSKIAIIITMFIGRVGPLSAAIVFALVQSRKDAPYKYPEGRITVG